jgi:hypothetical protein
MKKLILALLAAVSMAGCVVYAEPDTATPVTYSVGSGCTTYCDDYSCREVCGQYYRATDGSLVYWDSHFGIWVSPRGYWKAGRWYRGYHPGYHEHYHHNHVIRHR